ncbi:MAG: hypothetical protein V3U72_04915 [Candidatus Aenigmarchaeota archaeon]
MYYTFKMCKAGGFEVIPKGNVNLDLLKLAEKFENVKVKTKVILVVEINGARASIYPSGKILLHDCDEDKAHEIVTALYGMIKSVVMK